MTQEMSDSNDHQVLIIGGGVSGIVCALELNRLGVPATIVEKEATVGGLAARFCCKATEKCNKCFACVADKKVQEIGTHAHLTCLTDTRVTGVTGAPGSYTVHLRKAGSVSAHTAAAIVVAAGIDPYEASGKGEYGYGIIKNVVTARDLEEMLRTRGKITRPSDGLPPRTIAFIQCVGSRDESIGNLYCSQVCCAYALRLIRAIRHTDAEVKATFLYMDIQPAGASFHDFLSACRSDEGIRFIRTLPSRIYHSPRTDACLIRMADPERGEVVEEPFDMVVLSVGMVLNKEAKALGNLLGLELNEEGFFAVPPTDRGVFVTGACAGPKDIDRSITQAKSTAASVYDYLQGR
jgi:heterodisulfide reductase subunit A